jgi:hypothetical protein
MPSRANPGGITAIIKGAQRIEFKMQTLKLTIYDTRNYQFAVFAPALLAQLNWEQLSVILLAAH